MELAYDLAQKSSGKALLESRLSVISYRHALDLRSTAIILEQEELEDFQPKVKGMKYLTEVFENLKDKSEQVRAAEKALMDKDFLMRELRAHEFEEKLQQAGSKKDRSKVAAEWLKVEMEYGKRLQPHVLRLGKQVQLLRKDKLKNKDLSDVLAIQSVLTEKLAESIDLLHELNQELRKLKHVDSKGAETLVASRLTPRDASTMTKTLKEDIERQKFRFEAQRFLSDDLDDQIDNAEREIMGIEDENQSLDADMMRDRREMEYSKRILQQKEEILKDIFNKDAELGKCVESQNGYLRELQIRLEEFGKKVNLVHNAARNSDDLYEVKSGIASADKEIWRRNEENSKLHKIKNGLEAKMATAQEKYKALVEEETHLRQQEQSAEGHKTSMKATVKKQADKVQQLRTQEKQHKDSRLEKLCHLEQFEQEQRSLAERSEARRYLVRKAEKEKKVLIDEMDSAAKALKELQEAQKTAKEKEAKLKDKYKLAEEEINRLNAELEKGAKEFEGLRDMIIEIAENMSSPAEMQEKPSGWVKSLFGKRV